MPYKDIEKKREADREWYRRNKEKSTRSEPSQTEFGQFSDKEINELITANGLCRMLAKHILLLDSMPIEQVIKAKAISTLANTTGRIIANSDMEQELEELKAEVVQLHEIYSRGVL
jgi:hypothetical protein